jgi:nucleotide-binding universal stress UspA family protein
MAETLTVINETIIAQGCPCVVIDGVREARSSVAETTRAVHQHPAAKRVLVALGGAPAGETKLPVAEMLARALDADLVLLHVIIRPAAAVAEPVSTDEARAAAYLETVAARLHADGLHAHGLVRPAPSATEGIVAAARELRADLIVLGLDVRGRITRTFRQNVADEVARQTSCPVVIVQPNGAARRAPVVRSFDEDAARWGPLARWHLGVRPVPLARIIGSVGRANELRGGAELGGSPVAADARRQRYRRVLTAMRSDVALPAIELAKLGSGYYVVDGNHRVAAARELGQTEIDADVTEFVPLDDATAQRVFAERRAFERSTSLIEIDAAHYPGTYPRLAELVDAYVEQLAGPDRTADARRWYQRIYQPLVQEIHCQGLPRRFASKQLADLVAWVATVAGESFLCDEDADWPRVVERFASVAGIDNR